MTYFHTAIDTAYDTLLGYVIRFVERVITGSTEHTPLVPLLPEAPVKKDVEETSFKTVQAILESKVSSDVAVVKNTIMYTGSLAVPVYKNPTIEFDAQVAKIPYGEMVMMLEVRGRFYRVVWRDVEGWVVREDLVDRAARVYPEFVLGQGNSVDHPNTARVRTALGDTFGLSFSEFDLQAGEYVLYRLWKKGVTIAWPDIKPRVPGLWHKILRGVPGVHMGVLPKVGGIMEYMVTSEIGHVAYVEAVFPDDTIALSEANFPDSGIYNERELTKDEWKELKPIFITVQ